MANRFLLVPLVLGTLLFGTAATANAGPPDPALRVTERFLAAVEARDPEAVSAVLTDDVSLVAPYSLDGTSPGARFSGRAEVMGYLQNVFANFSQVRFVGREITVADRGRTVFVETRGDFIAARGDISYRNLYVFKNELRGGRVAAITEYASPAIFCATFGC